MARASLSDTEAVSKATRLAVFTADRRRGQEPTGPPGASTGQDFSLGVASDKMYKMCEMGVMCVPRYFVTQT